MTELRSRRGIQVTEQGLQLLQRAKVTKKNDEGRLTTYLDIATNAGVSEKTVKRFFGRKENVDWEYASAIARALDLELTDLIDAKATTPPPETAATFIDWREVCKTMLEPQRRTTSNFIMQDESARKDKEQIYVPLALVQRTKTDKRGKGNFSPDVGTRLYEPQYETQQRFEHEAFLSQILEHGEGKTKGQQIAVIGEPGAGKTTLLQTIAFWVLEKDLGLPVWISLADLGRNGTLTDIQTYIFNGWLEQAIPATQLTQEVREDFTNQTQQGRVWLLLDGVDEMSGGKASHQPLEEISRQLTGWLHSSRVVLTCRLNVWQADVNALETFETYRLLDFDYPQQVHQFIDNWFGNSKKGERLKAELDSAERVRLQDLVQTPLRLALLCGIWQTEEGNLPETKAGLYHQCVQQFYRWKQNRFRTSTKKQQELNKALARLALRDINEGSSRFRLRESFISQELGDVDDETSLFYKAWQLGWLNHVGITAESPSKEKVYAFYHATFEEYFATLAIDDWHYFLSHVPKNPQEGIYRIFEPQWKEVILLWLGREDVKKQQKEDFIKALVKFEDGCNSQSQIPDWKGFYEYRAYFIAAAGAGIAELKDCDLADVIAKQIVTWRYGYFNIEKQKWQTFDERIKAVLAETDRKKVSAALVELIRDSQNEYTRRQAASSLGEIAKDNPSAIAALVELIRDSQSEETRWQAASSLGEIAKDNPTVIAALLELIRDSQSEETRRQAASSLGKIAKNNSTAIAALVELIRDFQNESIRRQAASILGEIAENNPTAIAALVKLIHDSQNESTRRQAAYNLGKIAKDNPTTIAALVKLIHDSQNESTRRQAASSLGKIAKDNPTAITALVELTRDYQSEETRWQAASSLGEIAKDNPTAIAALMELIRDSQNESTRRQAAYNLGKIAENNPTAIAALVKLIHDSQSEETCRQAAYNLGEIAENNPNAIAALVELIHDSKNESIRRQAASSLGKIAKNNHTAIAALVKLIHDSQNESTRRQAASILGEIAKDNPTAIAALVKLIRDSQNEYTRWQAASNLGKIAKDNHTAIAALLKLIRDSQNESIRKQAASILGKIAKDNPTAIAALVKLISDYQNESIHRQAASILGEIAENNPTALAALVELIRDSQSEETRWQAASSLGEIAKDNPTALAALVELIRDSQNEYTRRQAASSLGKIAKNNPTAIAALVELIRDSQSQETRWQVASSLGEIAENNHTAIAALVKLIHDSQNESTRRQAASSLGKIAKDNPTAIAALVELTRDYQNEYTRWQAASSLGEIAKDNPTAIAALVELIRDYQNEYTRRQAAYSLRKILTKSDKMTAVVTALKNDLSDEAYEVIWHCTQTMTYPAFYQAWHSDSFPLQN
ncbi:HEAT repeat domain-containing protein [Nostoc sp.]|uniref:HEAT repeat domain-containing protein n=1 Tax=Nostoc sp. TaxID=1180 RepID=UPI002FF6C011